MQQPVRLCEDLVFVTITVIDWMDIFTRPKYKHIILESLKYCQQEKGLRIYGWVLMSNHLHAIVSSTSQLSVADIIRDFKKYTSKQVLSELIDDTSESRREWMLKRFRKDALNTTKTNGFRLWQEGYYPEVVSTYDFFKQKLTYIHNNPVKQEFVNKPENYLYSSALDYSGQKGLLDVCIVI